MRFFLISSFPSAHVDISFYILLPWNNCWRNRLFNLLFFRSSGKNGKKLRLLHYLLSRLLDSAVGNLDILAFELDTFTFGVLDYTFRMLKWYTVNKCEVTHWCRWVAIFSLFLMAFNEPNTFYGCDMFKNWPQLGFIRQHFKNFTPQHQS